MHRDTRKRLLDMSLFFLKIAFIAACLIFLARFI